jgi:hypothetical protein
MSKERNLKNILNFHTHITQFRGCREFSLILASVVFKLLYDLLSVFLLFILWKFAFQKRKWPKSKVKINVLNWSENVRFVERQPFFSRKWTALLEEWIRHLQYSTELYASWAVQFFSKVVSFWNHTPLTYSVCLVTQKKGKHSGV